MAGGGGGDGAPSTASLCRAASTSSAETTAGASSSSQASESPNLLFANASRLATAFLVSASSEADPVSKKAFKAGRTTSSADEIGSLKKSASTNMLSCASRFPANAGAKPTASGAPAIMASQVQRSAVSRCHCFKAWRDPSATNVTNAKACSATAPRQSTKRKAQTARSLSEESVWYALREAPTRRASTRTGSSKAVHFATARSASTTALDSSSSPEEPGPNAAFVDRPTRSSVDSSMCDASLFQTSACPSGYDPSPCLAASGAAAARLAATAAPSGSASLAPPSATASFEGSHLSAATSRSPKQTHTPCRPTPCPAPKTTRCKPCWTPRMPPKRAPSCQENPSTPNSRP
mmetsp:Transcript_1114/g.3909  ORF Transcript_1114/g.3909 Transcript_1114/m.3909 type:complete len:350 (-) Transcript_1114:146-1195(-)